MNSHAEPIYKGGIEEKSHNSTQPKQPKPRKTKQTQRKIRSREAGENDYCTLHVKAYDNTVEKYTAYRKALNTSWEAYLREIEQNSLTGNRAKKAAQHLTSKEEEKNGEEI